MALIHQLFPHDKNTNTSFTGKNVFNVNSILIILLQRTEKIKHAAMP